MIPTLTTWDFKSATGLAVLVLCLSIALVCLAVLRRGILPWLLHQLSRRIRVHSVSLRSIRGLYIRFGQLTVKVERFSLSYRRRNEEAARRLSLKFQNVEIQVYPIVRQRDRATRPTSQSLFRHGLSALSAVMRSFTDPLNIAGAVYFSFSWWLRPLLRLFFITIGRLLIRALPSLTQFLHIEVNHLAVIIMHLGGAKMEVDGVEISMSILLTRLEQVVSTQYLELAGADSSKTSSWGRSWRAGLWASANRTWDKAWGATEGQISIAVEVASATTVKPSTHARFKQWNDPRKEDYVHVLSQYRLILRSPSRLQASCGVNPRLGQLHKQSLTLSFDFAGVDFVRYPSHSPSPLGATRRSPDADKLDTSGKPKSAISLSSSLSNSSRWSKKNNLEDLVEAIEIEVRDFHFYCTLGTEEPTFPTFDILLPKLRANLTRHGGSESHFPSGWKGHIPCLEAQEYGDSWTTSLDVESIECHVFEGQRTPPPFPRVPSLVVPLKVTCFFQYPPSSYGIPNTPAAKEYTPPLCVIDIALGRIVVGLGLEQIAEILKKIPKHSSRNYSSINFTPIGIPSFHFYARSDGVSCCFMSGGNRNYEGGVAIRFETGSCFVESHLSYSTIGEPQFSHSTSEDLGDILLVGQGHIHGHWKSLVIQAYSFQDQGGDFHLSHLHSSERGVDRDPLFTMESMECSASWTASALRRKASAMPSLDPFTIALRYLVVMDDLAVEIWKEDIVQTLNVLGNHIRSLVDIWDSRPKRQPPSTAWPSYLSGACSITAITFLVTGHDLNPKCDLKLSRGVCLRTRVSIGYSSAPPDNETLSHSSQNLPRQAQLRKNLGLRDDCVSKCLSKLTALPEGEAGLFGLTLFSLDEVVLRRAVSTPYASNISRHQGLEAGFDDLDPDLILFSCPAAEFLLWTPLQNAMHGAKAPRLEIRIDDLFVRFQLLSAYACLRAMHTIHRVLGAWSSGADSSLASKSLATIDVILLLSRIRVLCILPLGQTCRVDALKFKHSILRTENPVSSMEMVTVYVPGRSSGWVQLISEDFIQCRLPSPGDPYQLRLGALQVTIPWGLVVADLILDIIITFKALKHFYGLNRDSLFRGIAEPGGEPPKKVPSFTIDCTSARFEIEDDPFEASLGLVWSTGLRAQCVRMERDAAFASKVAIIQESKRPSEDVTEGEERPFDPMHSISIEEAEERLRAVHSVTWVQMIRKAQGAKFRNTNSAYSTPYPKTSDTPEQTSQIGAALLRITAHQLSLHLESLSLGSGEIIALMGELGGPLPPAVAFTLWIPLHLEVRAHGLDVSLRDYPIPLFHILPQDDEVRGFALVSDLIIAEELGPPTSVLWMDCQISKADDDALGSRPFIIRVPKTVMPVKLYAKPELRVISPCTTIAWAVSYLPAIQGVAKIFEAFSHSPRDSSPPLGFWDKLRLNLHGSIGVFFEGDVMLYLKGTRDPYDMGPDGSGFAFCWRGHPSILAGHSNTARETFQITSDLMVIAIPNLECFRNRDLYQPSERWRDLPDRRRFSKVVARFTNGIRMGLGFILERACSEASCKCQSSPTKEPCRIFTFNSHHTVQIRAGPEAGLDSFDGFRSHFIHLSISLTSPIEGRATADEASTVHLSGLTFAHFWKWWDLFEGSMFLPIRQGTLYPGPRNSVPKFGKHLVTMKYRISVDNLFIAHIYNHDTVEAWHAGETRMIGVKVHMSRFRADLHQTDRTKSVEVYPTGSIKASRKVFNAVEVSIESIDFKTMFALFEDASKLSVKMPHEPSEPVQGPWLHAPPLAEHSEWMSLDDWVELGCYTSDKPKAHMLDFARCPHFSYRKSLPPDPEIHGTRFGDESTHSCLMGHAPSLKFIQLSLHRQQLRALNNAYQEALLEFPESKTFPGQLEMLDQQLYLEHLIEQLEQSADPTIAGSTLNSFTDSPPVTLTSGEGKGFIHVYRFHSPTLSLSNASRNIMMQYYYASRRRKGFEYHMTARAVHYLRKQTDTLHAEPSNSNEPRKPWHPVAGAQAAAQALKRILTREERVSTEDCSDALRDSAAFSPFDPAAGWTSSGISIDSSHSCLLLNPSIVLHSDGIAESTIVLVAAQAELQSFAVMDNSNADDSINGRIMSRTYAKLTGLQALAPTSPHATNNFIYSCLPPRGMEDGFNRSNNFDRLVPPTDARLQYDKFNRLRLRNQVSSVQAINMDNPDTELDHLRNHTDLILIDAPHISVEANSHHFGTISHVLTNLLLYSDPMYQRRAEELETYTILYDFQDLGEAARVIAEYQDRIRNLQRAAQDVDLFSDHSQVLFDEAWRLKAQILASLEELDIIFDAIKLSQEKANDTGQDQKMALRLLAKSSEISWRMLAPTSGLLAKLSLKGVQFSWLSRQDSSTENNLRISDFHAYDGSSIAVWPELLSKHYEPANHPLIKRAIFAEADWCVLPPVGGIAVYEQFKLTLHPIRLQIHTVIGSRIMEYIWPGQCASPPASAPLIPVEVTTEPPLLEVELDDIDESEVDESSQEVQEIASRSASDLRSAMQIKVPTLKRSRSFHSMNVAPTDVVGQNTSSAPTDDNAPNRPLAGPARALKEALEMRQRSAQKTFIRVEIASVHLLLSIMKEDAFLCRNAKIRTRELMFRNQTFSFEELVGQFVPSDPSWRGWVKMALHQPLLPVLPVAREIISKTKWGSKQAARILPRESKGKGKGRLKRRPKSKSLKDDGE